MGNDHSTNELGSSAKSYIFRLKSSHKYFGDYNLLEDQKSNKFLMQKEILYYTSANMDQEYKMLIQKMKKYDCNFLQIFTADIISEKGLCSNFDKINYVIDYPKCDLMTEILEHKEGKRIFSEDRIWNIMNDLISGLAELQKNNTLHNHLSNQSIFLDEIGNVKLMYPDIIKQTPNFAFIIGSNDRLGKYLSPEEMKCLKKKTYDTNINRFVSDVFVLGMILLEIIELKVSNEFYNYQECLIYKTLLEKKISTKHNIYSEDLFVVLRKMLIFDENKRPNFPQLMKIFKEQKSKREEEQIKVLKENENLTTFKETSVTCENKQIIKSPESNVKLNRRNYEKSSAKDKENVLCHSNSKILNRIKSPGQSAVKRTKEKEKEKDINIREFDNKKENYVNDPLNTQINFNISNSFVCTPKYAMPFSLEGANFAKAQEVIQEEVEFIEEEYEDGSTYEGSKLNNLRHGTGKFSYGDGGSYQGSWKFGKMEGFGTLFYPSGKIAYDGEWKDDKFHGKGVVYNELPLLAKQKMDCSDIANFEQFWVKYEGFFYEDNKEGKGRLFLTNGEVFEGTFRDDVAEGEGMFWKMDGEKVRGVWGMNKLIRGL